MEPLARLAQALILVWCGAILSRRSGAVGASAVRSIRYSGHPAVHRAPASTSTRPASFLWPAGGQLQGWAIPMIFGT